MSPVLTREGLDRKSGRRVAAPLRAFAAWLTLVAILVQLTATFSCAAGHASAPPRPFPICHASGVATDAVDVEEGYRLSLDPFGSAKCDVTPSLKIVRATIPSLPVLGNPVTTLFVAYVNKDEEALRQSRF